MIQALQISLKRLRLESLKVVYLSHYRILCLVDQEYFLDSNLKCGQYLKENNAEVVKFVKYIVGEGIEKKQDDFAAEVAAMAK